MSENQSPESHGWKFWKDMTDQEREQIRFLLRTLVIVVIFVVLASLVVGAVVSLL
ncbi:MAG: hypothetical protein ACOCXZ_03075 [Chloroflexota bacterium]